jgi:hypothetical protein
MKAYTFFLTWPNRRVGLSRHNKTEHHKNRRPICRCCLPSWALIERWWRGGWLLAMGWKSGHEPPYTAQQRFAAAGDAAAVDQPGG